MYVGRGHDSEEAAFAIPWPLSPWITTASRHTTGIEERSRKLTPWPQSKRGTRQRPLRISSCLLFLTASSWATLTNPPATSFSVASSLVLPVVPPLACRAAHCLVLVTASRSCAHAAATCSSFSTLSISTRSAVIAAASWSALALELANSKGASSEIFGLRLRSFGLSCWKRPATAVNAESYSEMSSKAAVPMRPRESTSTSMGGSGMHGKIGVGDVIECFGLSLSYVTCQLG